MKKISMFILSLAVVFFLLPAQAHAAETTDLENPNVLAEQGHDVIACNVEVCENGEYYIVTELDDANSENQMEVSALIDPDRQTTRQFTHRINDRNGVQMAVLTTTVTAVYSDFDNYAMITNITGSFSQQLFNGFSYTTSLDGDTGTIYIYLNGAYLGSQSYRIYQNGSLQNI